MRVPRDLDGLRGDGVQPPPARWRPPASGADSSAGRVLEFRRRAGLPVRRRSRWLGLVKQFVAALALVGTPAAALWWSATSPRFTLSQLEVETTDRVNREWVEARLAPLRGRNLVWMSMRGVERSLADHPWIHGVEVSKSLPDRLRVAVVERRPVAVLQAAEGRFYVDREGRVIAPVDGAAGSETPPAAAGSPEEYLVLREARGPEGEAGGAATDRQPGLRRALDAAQALSRVDPRWGAGLVEVEVLGEEDLVLRTRELPFPILVEAGTVEERVRALQAVLPEVLARVPRPARVDLRFEHRMVVRPVAAYPGSGSGDGRGEPNGQAG